GTFNSTLTLNNKVGTIENKQGGTISHDITINNGGSVEAINNAGTMQNITNSGTLSNITNSGTMKAITTKDGSLNNTGTIENLKITSGDFNLNNLEEGKIADIEINGNGNININDNMNIGYNNGISTFRIASGAAPTLNFGVVRTAITAQETYPTVKLVGANNANQTQAKVAIDKLIISLVGEDTQIGKSVSLANSVSGAANNGVGNIYIKSADFSQRLKESGFYGKFNLYTQTVDTRFNSNLGAAGLFSQVFINQLGRRSLLFDSFLNEASRASLRYKRTQPDTNFDIFVRPYYSKIKTDLTDIPEKADGTSSGILAGGHTYFDNSLLMLYGAVEKNKTHLADDVFNFNNDTFLLGSKYSIELAQSHIGQLFGGVDIRGSYTKADLEREPVSGFKSQGDTKNYAYDARVFLASIIYYDLQDRSKYLTPQIGIGHVGAKLKGFNMKGDRLAYKESLDDMTYGITYATASLNWFKRKDNVAIQLDGGVRVNLNNEINTQTRINNQNFTNHFEASKYYSQLGGAFMWINPYGVDISLGYKFLFGESATSHTANLRLHKTF
ncbi:autotransporter outer membrane beta-barrel domain-containing protein, partial [Campylobacter felis]|nr:autotransporter outer membrane beta-barrel domain-containing protein [Campylobacter felis]